MADFIGHEAAYRGDEAVSKRQGFKILILGAGALGSWLSDLLARQGYQSIAVLDMEKVDSDNFGTQNYGKSDTGRSKAQQTAQNIFRRIGIRVTPVHKKLGDGNIRSLLRGFDLVVDLFDNAASRELVRKFCAESKQECLHAGMSATGYFEVIWNEKYKVAFGHEEDPEAPCDYPLASNLVMLCVGATAEVINSFVDDDQKYDLDFWLNRMKMNKYDHQ